MAEKEKERIAIGIETGNSDAIENIRKCLDVEFCSVTSVSVNREIKAQRGERLEKEELNRKEGVLVINAEKSE